MAIIETKCTFTPKDVKALMQHYSPVAGVDEAGRGCLAGPVYAAAVILNPEQPIFGIKDSKKLSPSQRETLCDTIQTHALSWAIGIASTAEIDKINILQASLLAMERAVQKLDRVPTLALIDGNQLPRNLPCLSQAIIKGDSKVDAISAASIIAKVMRDTFMRWLSTIYPNYGFDQHKGYGTKKHLQAIKQYGITPYHRRSFKLQ